MKVTDRVLSLLFNYNLVEKDMRRSRNCTARYTHYIFATITALCLYVIPVAQVKFSTVVSEKQLGLNDYLQVEYTIENAKAVEKISPPSFKNFRVIQGPVQSNGVSYINGTISQYKSILFILQPLITGKVLVPGATAFVNGKPLRSDAVVIDVSNVVAKRNRTNPMPSLPQGLPQEENYVEEDYVLRPGETIAEKIKKNLMVLAEVNKTTCYEGEPVMVTFTLCSRLRSESKVLKRPSLNGFSVYDMVAPEDNNPRVQTINGKTYNVHTIRKAQLFPLQAGTFIIDPVELDNTVRFVKQEANSREGSSSMQSLLDELFDRNARREVEEHSFTLASKSLSITVKPLPALNRPTNFNGAVGSFAIKASLQDLTVGVGDAILLHVQVNGKGNFTVINPPEVLLPKGMEEFDPVVKENVDKTIYPLSGSKTFDYTFSAKDTGLYKIPPVSFSYFDPSEGRYQTIQSDSFTIHVVPSRKKAGIAQTTQPAVQPGVVSRMINSFSVNTFIALLAGLFVAAILLYTFVRNRRAKKVTAPSLTHASPLTLKATDEEKMEPLRPARQALHAQKSQEFYSHVNLAIRTRLAAVLHLPVTEINKFNAVASLRATGADAGMITLLESVLHECEIALYTPVHEMYNMQQTLARAEELMKTLNKPLT